MTLMQKLSYLIIWEDTLKTKKYLSFSSDKILDVNYKKVLNVLSFSSTLYYYM